MTAPAPRRSTRTTPPEPLVLPNVPTAPESITSEKNLLGSILINPDAFVLVSGILKSDDFFYLRHQHIWVAMTRLSERQEPIDIELLAEAIDNAGQLEAIGGRAYLAELTNSVPTSINAEFYAEIVRRTSVRRQYLKAFDDARTYALDENIDIETMQAKIEATIGSVSMKALRGGLEHVADVVAKDAARIEAHLDDGLAPIDGVPMPRLLPTFQKMMKGWRNGKLYYVGGYMHGGKTSFLIQSAIEAARSGEIVAFFSVEGTTEAISRDIIAMMSGLKADDIARGNITAAEYRQYLHATDELRDLAMFIDGDKQLDPKTMYRRIQQLMTLAGGRRVVVFVDYLGKLCIPKDLPPEKRGALERDNKLRTKYLSGAMQSTAETLGIPMIVAAQTARPEKPSNRKGRGGFDPKPERPRRPVAQDLADAAECERDAHVIIFPWRPDITKTEAEIIVAKNKVNGWIGGISCYFDKTTREHYESVGYAREDEEND